MYKQIMWSLVYFIGAGALGLFSITGIVLGIKVELLYAWYNWVLLVLILVIAFMLAFKFIITIIKLITRNQVRDYQ